MKLNKSQIVFMTIHNQLPFFKITLVHKLTGKKYTFYKSTTEYLAYDDTKFDSYIQTIKQKGHSLPNSMPSLF